MCFIKLQQLLLDVVQARPEVKQNALSQVSEAAMDAAVISVVLFCGKSGPPEGVLVDYWVAMIVS